MRASLRTALSALALSVLAFGAEARAQPAPARSPVPQPAPAAAPLTTAERKEVIEGLAKALEAEFVFPDVGARYAAMLRANLAAGAYDSLADPAAFAEKVTADL